MATPFVLGGLLNRHLTARISTSCAHSGRALEFDLDSEMEFTNRTPDSEPMVFMPDSCDDVVIVYY